jgi:hypothetical protein
MPTNIFIVDSVSGVMDDHKLTGRIKYSANVSIIMAAPAGRVYMMFTQEYMKLGNGPQNLCKSANAN